jgi:putative membrane protein
MPTTIEQRHQALMTQLSQLSGRTFDHAFLNSQLTEHNMAISLYQRHIQTGKNASLKAYATNSLPVLESHRNQIRAALTQLDR